MVKDRQSLYVVKRILDKKEEKGKPMYLIRWRGYTAKDDTWEPEEHLHEVRDLIDEFEHGNQPPPTPSPAPTPKVKSAKKERRTEHKEKPPTPPEPVHVPTIQGALDIDEVKQLTNLMWRSTQREFVCEVGYKPRVNGVQVQPSVERLADVRYRCPQLAIDLLITRVRLGL
jgi:hypothetical protein